jgi:nucleoside-diphosphate-sugar epimerase
MIYITGSTGFIGTSLVKSLLGEQIIQYKRSDTICIGGASSVIHLAGKAHDLKNSLHSDEYYLVNNVFSKIIFDAFLESEAIVFIFLSSVKAVADEVDGFLSEDHIPTPVTHYGKSKLLAEKYILSKDIPKGKRVYILRPCMVHGPGNKGNLNFLYKLTSKGIPWPLGAFDNKRSFCSIDNLLFIIKELIERDDIPTGVYNIADDEPMSTNMLISLIAKSKNRNPVIWRIPQKIMILLAKIGDLTRLPLNSERLEKLTQNYIVSNEKILNAIGKDLPMKATDGMMKTLNSFNRKI